ncbi:MAG TPA: histidine kinase [Clostridiaceae bacterium]|nr:histidine kinase [Clostridiaceae bacterium]
MLKSLYGKLVQSSVIRKLILSFMIIIVPFYAMGIIYYDVNKDIMSKEISGSFAAEVSFFIDSIEKEIKRIKIMQYDFLTDVDINKLVYTSEIMNEYEKGQAILRLQNRLYSIFSGSDYISDVRVHVPPLGKTIYARNSSSLMDEEEYMGVKDLTETSPSGIIFHKNKVIIKASNKYYSYGIKHVPFLIIVELSKSEFENRLKSFSSTEGSNVFLISPSQRLLISSNEDIQVQDEIFNVMRSRFLNGSTGSWPIKINGNSYLLVYQVSEYLGMAIFKYVPEGIIFADLKKSRIWFWVFTGSALAVIIIYSLHINRLIRIPLTKLVDSFKKVEAGNLKNVIKYNYKDEFKDIYEGFNAMLEKLQESINQVYEKNLLAQKAELKYLQSQITPHFLYNSFYILNRMIKSEKYEKAIAFSNHLGNYFRFITRSTSDEIPLESELEHARTYAIIQTMRFGNRIRIEFEELPERYRYFRVPRLIIQPIIENSIEHGLKNVESGGEIKLKFIENAGTFSIMIEDNGVVNETLLKELEKDIENDSFSGEITALINIQRRLKIMFPQGGGLKISRGSFGGMRTEIMFGKVLYDDVQASAD